MTDLAGGGASMHVYSRVASGRAELSIWSDGHHLESLTRPGWLSVRRFDLISAGEVSGGPTYDILTAFELESPAAADLILDRSFTPTPLPATVGAVESARALFLPAPAAGPEAASPSRATGSVLLQATLDFPDADPEAFEEWCRQPLIDLPATAGCVGSRRLVCIDSPLATLVRPAGTLRSLEQFELGGNDDVSDQLRLVTRAARDTGATGVDVSAYRQVYP